MGLTRFFCGFRTGQSPIPKWGLTRFFYSKNGTDPEFQMGSDPFFLFPKRGRPGFHTGQSPIPKWGLTRFLFQKQGRPGFHTGQSPIPKWGLTRFFCGFRTGQSPIQNGV
jgi:hypothetical protein